MSWTSGVIQIGRRLRIPPVPLGAFIAICAIVATSPVYAQISPGPLARAHESLNGPLNCTKCHEVGAGRELKCLTCHAEIRQRLAEHRGMHAVWVGTNQGAKICATCHSDHNGADFPLVRWQPSRERLDHRQTGFALTGKHAGVACASCHQAAKIPAAARASLVVKDLNRTFLGVSRDCVSCHSDEHRGQLGTSCARCHSSDGWKPASGFNHAGARFALTGAHATVACVKCHQVAAGPARSAVYTGLSFKTCTGCHTDPHKGSFAGTCQSCHETTSWTRSTRIAGFDHTKTAFALEGRHRAVACGACHRRGSFNTPVAHARCTDCHDDTHRGQFAARADRGDCAACHTVNNFTPSTFDAKAHASTRYPLDGHHAAVACASCHAPKGKDTVFRLAKTECAACHADVHQGQFAAAPHQNRCEDCHDVHGFAPAVFALARHRDTRFPLTGAHLAVPCVDCHISSTPGRPAPSVPTTATAARSARSTKGGPSPPPAARLPSQPAATPKAVKYVFADRACASCHEDPHRGEFRERMAAALSGGVGGCVVCHDTTRWTHLVSFDHASTGFALTGAHRGVACIDCHRSRTLETSTRNVDYRDAPKECAGCHTDVHAGEFASREDVAGCAGCHTVARWRPAAFAHDSRTAFPLTGAHRAVPCAGCHRPRRPVNGRVTLEYARTPTECKACHG